MSILRFTDGVKVDISEEYRNVETHDGWYVIGHWLMKPFTDQEEAIRVRDELIAASRKAENAAVAEGSTPKFPHVHVQLSGKDGNVFSIIGKVQRALREGGASDDDVHAFWEQVCNASSYDEALLTIMRWVDAS